MSSLNRCMIIGNLGKDPETAAIGGTTLTKLAVATSRSWTDKETGTVKDATTWHDIKCWGKLAEITAKFLSKGQKVYVEGEIQTESWETESGEKRYKTVIRANDIIFLSPPKNAPQGETAVDVAKQMAESAGMKTSTAGLKNYAPQKAGDKAPSFDNDEPLPF